MGKETVRKEERLNDILKSAKSCKNKGRLYVYEQYKQELSSLCLTSTEYEQACRKLTEYLKV